MKSTGTLYSLQLLRFIASVLVLFFHLELFPSGYKGVDIFFVISGYVMYYTSYILKPKSGTTFAINRLTKIFLLYWIALCVLLLFIPFTINLAFLKTLFLIPSHNSILGVSWSLSYELYFYLIFGCSFYLLPKKYNKYIFVFLLVISSIITVINTTPFSIKGSSWNFLFGQNLWEFLLGILGACMVERGLQSAKSGALLFILLLSSLLFLLINITYANPFSYIVYGFLSLLMIISITHFEQLKPFNTKLAGWLAFFGDASYAIYLFGPIITKGVMPESITAKISVIGITIILSVLFNKMLETPMLKLSRNKIHQLFSPAAG